MKQHLFNFSEPWESITFTEALCGEAVKGVRFSLEFDGEIVGLTVEEIAAKIPRLCRKCVKQPIRFKYVYVGCRGVEGESEQEL